MLNITKLARLNGFRLIKLGIPSVLFSIAVTATAPWGDWKAVTQSSEKSVALASVKPQPIVQSQLEAERVALRPHGFEPAEIRRSAGRFLLAVNDRSGRDHTTFTLTRLTGGRVHEVRMRDTPRKYEWRQLVNLPPGTYLLSEASNPQQVCQIILTAN